MVNANEFDFGEPITAELWGIDGIHRLRPLLWKNRSYGKKVRNEVLRTSQGHQQHNLQGPAKPPISQHICAS